MEKKIADKVTSIGKSKEKEKEKPEEIYIPPEKRKQIIGDLKLFWIIIIIILMAMRKKTKTNNFII